MRIASGTRNIFNRTFQCLLHIFEIRFKSYFTKVISTLIIILIFMILETPNFSYTKDEFLRKL